jgi:hypothetical protein
VALDNLRRGESFKRFAAFKILTPIPRKTRALDMLRIVAEDCLQQHAMALWGEPLDARRCQERLRLPEPAARARLAARLINILEAALANVTPLLALGHDKGFEDAVLDVLLCEIADSGTPEQVPSRHRLARGGRFSARLLPRAVEYRRYMCRCGRKPADAPPGFSGTLWSEPHRLSDGAAAQSRTCRFAET